MNSSTSNIKVGSFINIKLPDNHFKPVKKRSSNKLKSLVPNNGSNSQPTSGVHKTSNKQASQIKGNQSSNRSKEVILTEENRDCKLREFVEKIKSIYITELNKLKPNQVKTFVDEQEEKKICPVMPPFEFFMLNELDLGLRLRKFFKYLQEDDYLIGYFVEVNSKSKSDVKKAKFKLVSFDGGKKRVLYDLKQFVYYLIEDENPIKDDLTDKNVYKYFRFRVDKIIKDQIFVKFNSASDDFLKLGLVDSENLPDHLKTILRLKQQEATEDAKQPSFDSLLTSNTRFKNPNSIDYLLANLQIDNQQNYKSVEKEILNEELKMGIDCLKKEKFRESELHLNKALILEPNNSDVHVAKGCLLANQSDYKQSVKEFELAIKLNDKHFNAKKYLIETLSAYGKKLMKDNNYKSASNVYIRILELDPHNEDAIKSSNILKDNSLDDLDFRKSKKTKFT